MVTSSKEKGEENAVVEDVQRVSAAHADKLTHRI